MKLQTPKQQGMNKYKTHIEIQFDIYMYIYIHIHVQYLPYSEEQNCIKQFYILLNSFYCKKKKKNL